MVQTPVTMPHELQRWNECLVTSAYCLSVSKQYLAVWYGKLAYPYLTEHPNAVQCKTGYRLETEAETVVWCGSYAGYKKVQMTSMMIHHFWKMDH